MMSFRLMSALLFVLVTSTGSAMAQDDNALRSFLGDLTNPKSNSEVVRRVPLGQSEVQLSFAPLVKQTAPAVVNVYAARTVQQRQSPFMGDPFFEQFFGGRFGQAQPRVQSSLGSGVIVARSGLVVTNNHVIAGADEIKVALADGREFESKVVLRDERSDLAILKIEGNGDFPVLAFADSDGLQTGDLVLAIGNPFGVGQTVTSGIVSAVARSQSGVSDSGFFIQTDAAINPGNSGGALIDMQGRLVGINSEIYSRSGGSNGIGFAIPSNMVHAVVAQAEGGADAFERPYMGAFFDTVTAAMADGLGLDRPVGAIITDIDDKSPAAVAGLRIGDVILAVNGQAIDTPDALNYRLATMGVGDTVKMDVFSRGRKTQVRLTLQKQPAEVVSKSIALGGRGPFAGATVMALNPQILRKLRLQGNVQGVVISEIERGSPAHRAGFIPGDIIESVNGTEIKSVDTMKKVVDEGDRSWRFRINRGGNIMQQYLRF